MKKILFFLFLALSFVQCGEPNTTENATDGIEVTPKSVYIRMNTASFREKLAAATAPQLIDVRTPEEYEAGHIDRAVLINYKGDNFKEEIAKLDKEAPLFVYCQAGGRSKRACDIMKGMGFSEIYELKDGYGSWK